MSYADATQFQDNIQPRRIAATAVAISIHVAILMMLMMPASVPSKVDVEENVPIIDPVVPKIPITPPPPKDVVKTKIETTPQPVHQTAPEQLVESVDQSDPGPLDVPLTPVGPEPIGPVDTGPSLVNIGVQYGPAPSYPRPAIQRGFEGTVLLRIHVDATGHPIEVSIEQSSGFRILDEAALKQVQARWLFVPAQKNGQATDAWGLLPVQFTLK